MIVLRVALLKHKDTSNKFEKLYSEVCQRRSLRQIRLMDVGPGGESRKMTSSQSIVLPFHTFEIRHVGTSGSREP
jgi:hypothetical protein